MTEKRGGSDVGAATDTHAVYRDGDFELHGYKWFTSAITSDMTLTLGTIFQLFCLYRYKVRAFSESGWPKTT